MKLDGIHHITLITADARRNVEFYTRVLGLRFLKKTVNHDMPTVYHLYYGDDEARPGSFLTYFEFPDAGPGEQGAGMIHTITYRVPSEDSLNYWEDRLAKHGVKTENDGSLTFQDYEGMRYELLVDDSNDEPLKAAHHGVDPDHALLGFGGVRAYAGSTDHSEAFLTEILGFERAGRTFTVSGSERSAFYAYDDAPGRGYEGAGTVHHIAWASEMSDHEMWQQKVSAVHPAVTPIIDRMYFRSIYFREPSGVLFEIATKGPGFTYDEPMETLGQSLVLPERYEHMRSELASKLTPIDDLLVD